VALRQGHGLLRTLPSVVEPPLEQVCLGEPCKLHRPSHAHRAHRRCVSRHLLEKAPSLERTLGERVRVSETSEDRPGLEVPRTNEGARAFQRIDGPVEITLGEGHAPDARQGLGKGEWVVSAFRDPECLLGMRPRIIESPQTREGQGEPRT
jgi:hypothetical protein